MARILVADDAQFIRSWYRRTLTAEGHEVLEADDGERAVALYADERPDAVLLDVVMPVTDGLAALRRIREIDPNARVIVITAEGQLDILHAARRAGATDFLLKPCPKEVLLEKLARALR